MEAKASIREIRILALCSALALMAAPPTFMQVPFVSLLLALAGLASGVLAMAMWILGKRRPFSGFVGWPLEYKAFVTVGILGMCLALGSLAALTYLGIMSMLGIALTEHARPPERVFALATVVAWCAVFQGLGRARRSAQRRRRVM